MLFSCSAPSPTLLSVTVCAGPVAPCVPKFRTPVEKLATGALACPVRATVWGLNGSLSLTVSVPAWIPEAPRGGLKVTLIVQFAPAARPLPQLLVCAKSPLVPMPVMVSVFAPTLKSVTVPGALVVPTNWSPKFSCVGNTNTSVTRPLRLTLCGLPVTLSAMDRVALSALPVVGVKVTLIVQLDPGAKVAGRAPQVLVSAKSALFVPVNVMPVSVSDESPLLVTVIVCGVLVEPLPWVGKTRVVGDIKISAPTTTLETKASQFPPAAGCSGR